MAHKLAALRMSAAVVCIGSLASWAEVPPHMMMTPEELRWTDVASLPAEAKLAVIERPLTEAVPFTFRLKLPANYKIPAHWHPVIEHVTVISGTFHMGVGDNLDTAETKPLTAGSVARLDEGRDDSSDSRDRTTQGAPSEPRASSQQDHVAWVAQVLVRMQTIKPVCREVHAVV